MRVLVTGGCGFVGLCVAEELVAEGHHVVLVDRPDVPKLIRDAIAALGSQVELAVSDVTCGDDTLSQFVDHKPDRIVHLATVTANGWRESNAPAEVIDVNVIGTINVLKAAQACGATRIVYVGSGSAYGAAWYDGQLLVEEVSPSKPHTLYGVSKLAAEQAALRLGSLWDLDVIAVRLGSVCGPWERSTSARTRMSPYLQLARLAGAGSKAIIPAREVIRDWVYSRDVAAGISAILAAPQPAHAMYHLSSALDWSSGLACWCDALRSVYPDFSFDIASSSMPANVDMMEHRDRAQMSIRRLIEDIGFVPQFDAARASEDYAGWLATHPDIINCGI